MGKNIIETYLERPINGVPLLGVLTGIADQEGVERGLLPLLHELARSGVRFQEARKGTMVEANQLPDLDLGTVPPLGMEHIEQIGDWEWDSQLPDLGLGTVPPLGMEHMEPLDAASELTDVKGREALVASMIGTALHTLSGARDSEEVKRMLRGFGEEITAILNGEPIQARTERLDSFSLGQLAGQRDACDVRVVIEGTLMAKANVHRLYAALVNLIKNADNVFKQNGQWGNVEVRARTEGEQIVITVTDNAGGIPDRIWENLWTGGESGTGGTGTGLRDVKKSLAGWADVSAEQQVTWANGIGARFTLRLEAVPNGADFSFLKERPINPNLILTVDDHPMNGTIMERMLAIIAPGCEILLAESVEDAANQMRERSDAPRLVLTDDEMPGELGSDMALKMRGANTDIKIVITSANKERTDLDAMQELGLQTLPKPVTLEKLTEVVQSKA